MTKLRSKEVASAELDGSFHRSTTDDLKYPAATTDQKYGVHREEPHKEPLQSVHLALMCSERELSSRRVQASNLATTVSDLSTKVSTTSAENLRLKGRNLELQQELSAAKREAAAALTRAASLQREVLSARGMAVDAQREAVQAQGEVEKARAEVGVAQRDAALAIVRARASEDSVEEAIRSIEQLKEQVVEARATTEDVREEASAALARAEEAESILNRSREMLEVLKVKTNALKTDLMATTSREKHLREDLGLLSAKYAEVKPKALRSEQLEAELSAARLHEDRLREDMVDLSREVHAMRQTARRCAQESKDDKMKASKALDLSHAAIERAEAAKHDAEAAELGAERAREHALEQGRAVEILGEELDKVKGLYRSATLDLEASKELVEDLQNQVQASQRVGDELVDTRQGKQKLEILLATSGEEMMQLRLKKHQESKLIHDILEGLRRQLHDSNRFSSRSLKDPRSMVSGSNVSPSGNAESPSFTHASPHLILSQGVGGYEALGSEQNAETPSLTHSAPHLSLGLGGEGYEALGYELNAESPSFAHPSPHLSLGQESGGCEALGSELTADLAALLSDYHEAQHELEMNRIQVDEQLAELDIAATSMSLLAAGAEEASEQLRQCKANHELATAQLEECKNQRIQLTSTIAELKGTLQVAHNEKNEVECTALGLKQKLNDQEQDLESSRAELKSLTAKLKGAEETRLSSLDSMDLFQSQVQSQGQTIQSLEAELRFANERMYDEGEMRHSIMNRLETLEATTASAQRQLEDMEQAVHRAEDKAAALETEKALVEAALASTEASKRGLEKKLADATESVHSLELLLAEAQAEAQVAEKKAVLLDSEKRSAQDKLARAEAGRQSVDHALQLAGADKVARDKLCEELEASKLALSKERNQLQEQAQATYSELATMHSNLAAVKTELVNLSLAHEDAKVCKLELADRLKSVSCELERCKPELEASTSSCAKLSTSLAQCQAQLQTKTDALFAAQTRMTQCSADLAHETAARKQAKSELEQLLGTVKRQSEEAAELGEESQKHKDELFHCRLEGIELKTKLAAVSAESKQLEVCLSTAREKEAEAISEGSSLQGELAQLKSELEMLKLGKAHVVKQSEVQRGELDQQAVQLSVLNVTLAEHQKSEAVLLSSKQALEAEAERLERGLADVRQQVDELQKLADEGARDKAELFILQEQRLHTEEFVAQLQSEIEEMTCRLQDCSSEFAGIERMLREELLGLEATIRDTEEQNLTFLRERQVLEQDCYAAKQSLARLQTTLEERDAKVESLIQERAGVARTGLALLEERDRQVVTLRDDLQRQHMEREKLGVQLEACWRELQSMQAVIKDHESCNLESENNEVQLLVDQKQLVTSHQALEEELEVLRAQVMELEREGDESKKENDKQHQVMVQWETDLSVLQKEKEEVQHMVQTSAAELTDQTASLQLECSALRREVEAGVRDLDLVNVQHQEELSRRDRATREETTRLQAEFDILQVEMNELMKNAGRIEQLQEELDNCGRAAATWRQERTLMQSEVDSLRTAALIHTQDAQTIMHLREEAQSMEREVARLKSIQARQQVDMNRLTLAAQTQMNDSENLAKLRCELANQGKELAVLRSRERQLQFELERAKKEIQVLSASGATVKALESKICQHERERDAWFLEKERLEDQLAAVRQQARSNSSSKWKQDRSPRQHTPRSSTEGPAQRDQPEWEEVQTKGTGGDGLGDFISELQTLTQALGASPLSNPTSRVHSPRPTTSRVRSPSPTTSRVRSPTPTTSRDPSPSPTTSRDRSQGSRSSMLGGRPDRSVDGRDSLAWGARDSFQRPGRSVDGRGSLSEGEREALQDQARNTLDERDALQEHALNMQEALLSTASVAAAAAAVSAASAVLPMAPASRQGASSSSGSARGEVAKLSASSASFGKAVAGAASSMYLDRAEGQECSFGSPSPSQHRSDRSHGSYDSPDGHSTASRDHECSFAIARMPSLSGDMRRPSTSFQDLCKLAEDAEKQIIDLSSSGEQDAHMLPSKPTSFDFYPSYHSVNIGSVVSGPPSLSSSDTEPILTTESSRGRVDLPASASDQGEEKQHGKAPKQQAPQQQQNQQQQHTSPTGRKQMPAASNSLLETPTPSSLERFFGISNAHTSKADAMASPPATMPKAFKPMANVTTTDHHSHRHSQPQPPHTQDTTPASKSPDGTSPYGLLNRGPAVRVPESPILPSVLDHDPNAELAVRLAAMNDALLALQDTGSGWDT